MIVVTGGAGFIGSYLVGELCARGDQPVIVCDWIESPEKEANLRKHDVAERVTPEALFDWLAEHKNTVTAIFHMGASSSTVETNVDFILDNNLDYSLRLWRWCAANDVRFIYASSAATYGDGANGFVDDNDASALAGLKPQNLYGWSKLAFDLNAVTLAAAGVHPPQWAGLKFFNVYGPNEYHKGGQRSLVVQLYEQISKTGGARLFRSHHPDYEDGGQSRDFVWVGDCVDIALWLLDNPTANGVFNVGTGQARSFADLARACFAAMDLP
ncbi:MAG: ADP-glyceromanno-heptose 6-epimerase, partial [Alphaproteobacteria bacterium]|nr:ADP-glyceromanno-heptose 6-epimerase [Alphaproteobacteria bacterium]